MSAEDPLPKIGVPAIRALTQAGVETMADLDGADLDHLATLHGIGPKAIRLLRAALDDHSPEKDAGARSGEPEQPQRTLEDRSP